ncbi:MAG: aldo/keto reductase [Candidatus Dadabacteria bacterium]|nr:MAG: aldo/keto reductase [Candidatus Dadabacteria bacterium]
MSKRHCKVEYTLLGKTDIKVSRLCLGGWQASGWSTCSEQGFMAVINRALDLGINFIDTAEGYGNGLSETIIGKVIRERGCRDSVVIASKFSPNHCRAAQVRKSLEKTLKRLGTDYIDLYQQHWPPANCSLLESIEELERLKEEGKIKAIGVSNWMEPEWEEIDNPARIDVLQPCYSLLWRPCEKKVLPLCHEHKIAVIPYSPLCQGILSGKYKSREDFPDDVRRQNRRLSREEFVEVKKVLSVLEEIAAFYDRTPAQTALRWLLDNPVVTAPIIGASRPAQVEDNCGALGWSLKRDDYKRLCEVSNALSLHLKPHDTLWNWHSRGR